jgi:hypothetical protein
MLTVLIILVLAAFIVTVASAASPTKVPLWVAVLLLCIIELLRTLPLGK